jgi:hypothetical protein
MEVNYIDGMLLVLRPQLRDPDKARNILLRYWQHRKAFVWTVDDVHLAVDERGKLPGASQVNTGVTFDLGPMGTIVTGSENGHASSITVDGVKIQGSPNTFTADRTLIAKALKLGLKNLALVDGLTPLVFSDATRKLVIAPLRADPTPRTSVPVPVQPSTAASSPEPTTSTDNHQQQGDAVKTINRINPSETTTSNGTSEMEQQQENSSPLKQSTG